MMDGESLLLTALQRVRSGETLSFVVVSMHPGGHTSMATWISDYTSEREAISNAMHVGAQTLLSTSICATCGSDYLQPLCGECF